MTDPLERLKQLGMMVGMFSVAAVADPFSNETFWTVPKVGRPRGRMATLPTALPQKSNSHLDRVGTGSDSDLVERERVKIVKEYRMLIADQVATAPCTDKLSNKGDKAIHYFTVAAWTAEGTGGTLTGPPPWDGRITDRLLYPGESVHAGQSDFPIVP